MGVIVEIQWTYRPVHTAGAYTATRTLNRVAVMNWNAHLNRLVASWANMEWETPLHPTNPAPLDPSPIAADRNIDSMKQSISNALRMALQQYYAREGHEQAIKEATITILLLKPTPTNVELRIHIELQLASTPAAAYTVGFLGSPRLHPRVKDSQWSRYENLHFLPFQVEFIKPRKLSSDRAPIESAGMKPGIHELLLYDTEGCIYEGLTSNFYVLVKERDGTVAVVTAPRDHVLNGTILDNVESACKKLSIPIRFEFPRVDEVGRWVGAFVTSSLRILVQVKRVQLMDGMMVEMPVEGTDAVERIKEGVWKELEENAVAFCIDA
ncbi:hypothetical protein HDU98_003904 [Podochytrium sp. JEL0797]|nr:hypothetical protein HDU98_003904 [Podochytrium sp. JEL0797]